MNQLFSWVVPVLYIIHAVVYTRKGLCLSWIGVWHTCNVSVVYLHHPYLFIAEPQESHANKTLVRDRSRRRITVRLNCKFRVHWTCMERFQVLFRDSHGSSSCGRESLCRQGGLEKRTKDCEK